MPGVAPIVVVWGRCGAWSAYLVDLMTEVGRIVPPVERSQMNGLASSGVLAAQGIGLVGGGGASVG